MNNAVWKLATLAGIIGIGLLVVMNAQREIQDKLGNGSEKTPVASLGSPGDPNAADGKAEPPQGNGEPAFGPEGFREDSDPVPAAEKSKRLRQGPTPVEELEDNTPKLADSSPGKRRLPDDDADLVPVPEDAPLAAPSRPQNLLDNDPDSVPIEPRSRDTRKSAAPSLASDDTGDQPLEADMTLPDDEYLRNSPGSEPSVFDDPTLEADPAASRRPLEDDTGDQRQPADAPTLSGSPLDDDEPLRPADTGAKPRPQPESEREPDPISPVENLQPIRTGAPKGNSLSDDDSSFGSDRTPREGPEPTPADAPAESRAEPGPTPTPSIGDDDDIVPRRNDSPPTPAAAEPEIAPASTPTVRDDEETIRGRERPSGEPLRSAPETEPALPTASRNSPAPRIVEDEDFITGPRSGEGARVDVTKSAPAAAVIGERIAYQILVRNSGTARAAQVVIEDRIPRGVDLESTEPQAEVVDSRLIWKLGALEAGEQRKITVRVVPRVEGKIGTVAMVRFASSNAAETTVAAPRLKFELLGPPQAMLGSSVTFRFRVTNLGATEARKVFIQSRLPAELSHPGGDVLSCDIGTLKPGKSDEVPLTLTAARQGSAAYKAVVTADGGVNVEAESRIDIIGANFKLTRTGPKRIFLGKSSTFINEVFNKDARPVANLTIVEKVPAGLKFVQASAGGRYDPAKREVTWQIRQLDPGQRTTVEVVLSSADRGPQVTTVKAFDPTAMAVVDFTTNGQGVSALSVDMSDPDTPQIVGDTFPCKVRVINRGSDVAGDVRISVVIPANTKLVRAKGASDYRLVKNELQFAAISVDSRQEAVIDLELQAQTPGEARIQVLLTSDRITDPLRSEENTTIVTPEE